MTDKTVIKTDAAPAPAPIFSQGVRKGPILQVAGQGPFDAETGDCVLPGDVKAQTVKTLENVEAILTAGGATFDDVVMLRVYLTTREHFAAMNEAYGEFVTARTSALPARTTVFVDLPREEMLVEIDALAVVS